MTKHDMVENIVDKFIQLVNERTGVSFQKHEMPMFHMLIEAIVDELSVESDVELSGQPMMNHNDISEMIGGEDDQV